MPEKRAPEDAENTIIGGATERATRYQERAARFRQMAEAETRPLARRELFNLAGEYYALADRLETTPRQYYGLGRLRR